VNEFGDIGLDAALIDPGEEGVAFAEVAGGCVCCVNGAPFTVALSRLLRASRPHRLLIELSGLSHPQPLLQQLKAAPWAGVLSLQALVVVLDGLALREGGRLPQAVLEAMAQPCTLVVNKADTLSTDDRTRIEARIQRPALWISKGQLDWEGVSTPAAPARTEQQVRYTATASKPGEGWSKGWLVPPEQVIDIHKVEAFLQTWPWVRAKAIIHTQSGWRSTNLLPGGPITWRSSEWRKDSRLELIFDHPQHNEQLNEQWAACLATL
jgi:G3E family GTPase